MTSMKNMERFDKALANTLKHEGGFVNDPADPGGATKYGISLRFLRSLGEIEKYDYDSDGDIDVQDILKLTKEHARGLYYLEFWFDEYEELRHDSIAAKIFDISVNVGTRQGIKLVQTALNNRVPPGWGEQLVIDGVLGPLTLSLLKYCTFSKIYADRFIEELENVQARFYFSLVVKRPALRKFLHGWLKRAYYKVEV